MHTSEWGGGHTPPSQNNSGPAPWPVPSCPPRWGPGRQSWRWAASGPSSPPGPAGWRGRWRTWPANCLAHTTPPQGRPDGLGLRTKPCQLSQFKAVGVSIGKSDRNFIYFLQVLEFHKFSAKFRLSLLIQLAAKLTDWFVPILCRLRGTCWEAWILGDYDIPICGTHCFGLDRFLSNKLTCSFLPHKIHSAKWQCRHHRRSPSEWISFCNTWKGKNDQPIFKQFDGHSLVLPDDALMELDLQVEQGLPFGLGHLLHRNAGPRRHDVGDDLGAHHHRSLRRRNAALLQTTQWRLWRGCVLKSSWGIIPTDGEIAHNNVPKWSQKQTKNNFWSVMKQTRKWRHSTCFSITPTDWKFSGGERKFGLVITSLRDLWNSLSSNSFLTSTLFTPLWHLPQFSRSHWKFSTNLRNIPTINSHKLI